MPVWQFSQSRTFTCSVKHLSRYFGTFASAVFSTIGADVAEFQLSAVEGHAVKVYQTLNVPLYHVG